MAVREAALPDTAAEAEEAEPEMQTTAVRGITAAQDTVEKALRAEWSAAAQVVTAGSGVWRRRGAPMAAAAAEDPPPIVGESPAGRVQPAPSS